MAGREAAAAQQTYVFVAELVGFEGVVRTISARGDLTLVDLHYALQAAFDWDDDHLYSFWLQGSFWEPSARLKNAQVRLDQLELASNERLAYVFDFASEWRVRLQLRAVVDDDGSASPRLLASAGTAPPQYAAIEVHRRERVYVSADGAST